MSIDSQKDAKIAAMRNILYWKVLIAKCPKLFSSNLYYFMHGVKCAIMKETFMFM